VLIGAARLKGQQAPALEGVDPSMMTSQMGGVPEIKPSK
jgi:hypothetical protein